MTGIGRLPDVDWGAIFRVWRLGHCVCKRLFARLALRGFGTFGDSAASPLKTPPASKACPTFGVLATWRVFLDASRNTPPPIEVTGLKPTYSLWQLVMYALRLGTLGFGGPVALVGFMYRDLVEQRKWISETDYKEGLALAQLMPGPLAAQLAIYLGYVHYQIVGATLVGVAFVLPSFLIVIALGAAYVAYGGLTWMQAVFYGVGASVIGIIAISAYKLTTKSIGKDKLLWAIYVCAAAVTIVTESEIVWLFLISGVLVWLVKAPPKNWFGGGASSMAIAVAQL